MIDINPSPSSEIRTMFSSGIRTTDPMGPFGTPFFEEKIPRGCGRRPSGTNQNQKRPFFWDFDGLGSFWSYFDIFVYICQIWPPNSELLALRPAACAQDLASRNSSPDPGYPGYPPYPVKVALGPLLATPFNRARGLGWREFEANSLKTT